MRGSKTIIIFAILGVVAVVFAVTCVVLTAARVRNDRRRLDRLSIAFARAQAVRTLGIGVQGSPYSLYAEPVWSDRRGRRGE